MNRKQRILNGIVILHILFAVYLCDESPNGKDHGQNTFAVMYSFFGIRVSGVPAVCGATRADTLRDPGPMERTRNFRKRRSTQRGAAPVAGHRQRPDTRGERISHCGAAVPGNRAANRLSGSGARTRADAGDGQDLSPCLLFFPPGRELLLPDLSARIRRCRGACGGRPGLCRNRTRDTFPRTLDQSPAADREPEASFDRVAAVHGT